MVLHLKVNVDLSRLLLDGVLTQPWLVPNSLRHVVHRKLLVEVDDALDLDIERWVKHPWLKIILLQFNEFFLIIDRFTFSMIVYFFHHLVSVFCMLPLVRNDYLVHYLSRQLSILLYHKLWTILGQRINSLAAGIFNLVHATFWSFLVQSRVLLWYCQLWCVAVFNFPFAICRFIYALPIFIFYFHIEWH